MNNILRTTKYLFNDCKKSMAIFYGIILGLSAIMTYTYFIFRQQATGDMSFGGFENSSLIFVFVLGLNAFKANFRFLQANNVSRKRFFVATILSFLAVAGVMAIVDQVLARTLQAIIPYKYLFQEVYKTNAILPNLIFSIAFLAFAAGLGWFINMLFYKCNAVMKLVLSLSPIVIFYLAYRLDVILNGAFSRGTAAFLKTILGLKTGNSMIAALSFTVLFAIISGLNFVLVRRMTIKD